LDSVSEKISELIEQLEELCSEAERVLVARDWDALMSTLADQRRIIQALTNMVAATAGQRTEEFDRAANKRVRRILAFRENQLKRLETFRDSVRGRLQLISKAKQVGRYHTAAPRPGLARLDLLR
jgi:nitrogen-specific signal transduction histidine kinase